MLSSGWQTLVGVDSKTMRSLGEEVPQPEIIWAEKEGTEGRHVVVFPLWPVAMSVEGGWPGPGRLGSLDGFEALA